MRTFIAGLAAALIGAFPYPAFAAGKLYYGTRAGMEVTVISMEGLDTPRAIIRTQHTKEDAIKFCQEYIGAVSDKCIQDALAVRLSDEITANCDTGIFSNFFGYKIHFLGLNRRDTRTEYLLKNLATGDFADGSTASGYSTDLQIFKALCPRKAPYQFDQRTGAVIAPSASYIGNWYVSNSSVCKDRPGESSELVTYTRDRTMSPEMSCKVLRTTPRGAATELDLLCNGEGERGFRQKELVQVTNGHLEVSYVANGRKSIDKYLRCP
jgi:hypothetical protein